MSIVTINLSNKSFKLYCPEENKEALIRVAEKLDNEIDKMRVSNPNASFELLLVMTALNLQDERQSQLNQSGGQILENANKDFQNTLSSIFSELETVANKFK
jgi:cell division protein ZapA (FtsZ GTPase activity inhibitor)